MQIYDEIQETRDLVIKNLDLLSRIAYSGLPEIEYNAILVLKAFLKTKSIEDRLTNDPKSSGSEDK